MKVIVTGATGFIGKNLVKALLDEGISVKAILMHSDSTKMPANVEVLRAELDNKDELLKAVKDADALVHLAAMLGKPGVTREQLEKVNVEGTRNVLEAADKNGIKKFVYLSGTMVMGSSSEAMDENTVCNPIGDYAETKFAAENIAREFKGKTNCIVLRSTMVYGPGETANRLKIFKMIKKGHYFIFGRGNNKLGLVHVKDLCTAITLAIKKDNAAGTYIISGGNYTMNDFVYAIADSLKAKKPIHIPLLIAWPGAVFLAIAGFVLRREMPLFPSRLKNLTSNQEVDISKAKKELGYSPVVSLNDGISETMRWYENEGLL